MRIIRGRAPEGASQQRTETFTGTVWSDPVLPTSDGVTANNVFFTPSARTHWHHHEHGQLLYVTAGSGRICSEGEAPETIRAGDSVWVPAAETHWHGAAPDSYMLHLAISLGTTHWATPVTDTEYEGLR